MGRSLYSFNLREGFVTADREKMNIPWIKALLVVYEVNIYFKNKCLLVALFEVGIRVGSGPAFFGVVGKRTRFLDLEKKLMSIVTPVLNKLGYELVQIKVFSKGRVRVQVMVEPLDCSKILLEECALVSREISAILDFEDNFKYQQE